jgi:hypothetical protein
MGDGNEFHTLVWIVDQVLVQRDVAGKLQWWVADAASGAPIEQAVIDYFGYRVEPIERKLPLGRRMDVKWREFQKTTDADGKTLLKPGDWDDNYQWLAIARKASEAHVHVRRFVQRVKHREPLRQCVCPPTESMAEIILMIEIIVTRPVSVELVAG